MPHSIAIVDDHVLIAQALTGLVETMGDYKVLYEVSNGKAFIERLSHPENIPDIALLDIIMPEMDGFDTAQWLRVNHPAIRILVLSMQDQEEMLIKMMRFGARGYLLKDVSAIVLRKALDSIVEKGYFYPEWITHKVLMHLSDEKPVGPDINAREMEFLNHAISELSYKEIADKMCCSPRTVEGYRDHLFEKLHVKTRVGLVITALKSQLIRL